MQVRRVTLGQPGRIVVDIRHACVRPDFLDDLVQVGAGRNARADVQEVADTCLGGEETRGASEKRTILPGSQPSGGKRCQHLLCGGAGSWTVPVGVGSGRAARERQRVIVGRVGRAFVPGELAA